MSNEVSTKKLYRLPQQKKIAGVCSGLGEYFDLDPVLFRLLFIVLLFFSGIGLLAYIVLWIMVPEKDAPAATATSELRLSRTDRKIAGVCGGLGRYFEIDPVILRAIFVVLAFIAGLGILLYVVLWLVLPSAEAPPLLEQPPSSKENEPGPGS